MMTNEHNFEMGKSNGETATISVFLKNDKIENQIRTNAPMLYC